MGGVTRESVQRFALSNLSVILLAAVFLLFAALDSRFLSISNIMNIGSQASFIGIMAVGMTFVLLIAGIDLSVGAVAYFSAVVMGGILRDVGMSPIMIAVGMMAFGAACGFLNGALVSIFKITPFIVTLAAMGIYRGLALGQSQSREVNFPMEMLAIGSARPLGIPVPLWIFLAVLLIAHLVLTRTSYGRQLYAVGRDAAEAEKAGLPVRRITWSAYVVSGACAGLAAFVSVIQMGTIVPAYGTGDEFDAIAAAVLGGASLFGGRGTVLPGALVGTLLVQTIAAGMVFTRVDLYMTPMVSAVVIFVAVVLDTLRTKRLDRLGRQRIRPETRPA